MRAVDDRDKMEAAESHDEIHHLKWARYLYFSPFQDTQWERVQFCLSKEWLLLA